MDEFGPPSGSGRPATATVFGILNLVYGGLGLLCNPINGVLNVIIPTPPRVDNPAFAIAFQPAYRAAVITYAVTSTVACALLLASGIGLLRMKPWGRSLAVAYGILDVVAALGYFGFNWFYLFGPLIEAGRQANNPAVMGNAIGTIIGGAGVIVVAMIYPVVLLVFMTRPRIVQAFAPRDPWAPWAPPAA